MKRRDVLKAGGLAALVDVERLERLVGPGGVDSRSVAGSLSEAAGADRACSLGVAPGPVDVALDRELAVEAGARGSLLTDAGAIDVAAGVSGVDVDDAVDALVGRGYRRTESDGRPLYVTRRRRRYRAVATGEGTVVVGTGLDAAVVREAVSTVADATDGEATRSTPFTPTGPDARTGETRRLVNCLLRSTDDWAGGERSGGDAGVTTAAYLAAERFDGGPSGMDSSLVGAGETLSVVDGTGRLTSVVLFGSASRRRRSRLLDGSTDRLASVPGLSTLPKGSVPSVRTSGRLVVRRARVDARRLLTARDR